MTDPAYVALALVPGIGRVRLEVLLGACESPAAVFAAPARHLAGLPGMGRAAATAIHATDPASGERVIARTERAGGHVLAPDDPRFPPALREIPDAPTLLFAAGDLARLRRPAVAIVGSRSHTRYGG